MDNTITHIDPSQIVPAKVKKPEILEFQPDIVAIEERPAPKAAEWTLLSVVALIAASVTWASLAMVDRIVTTQGKLITTSSKIVVQPIETGVVRTLNVRRGEVVRKGQILATLDATFADADVTASRGQFVSLAAQVARLEAELAGDKSGQFSEDTDEQNLQLGIFNKRHEEYQANMAALDAEIHELQAQERTNRAEIADLRDQLKIMTEVEGMRAELLRRNSGSRLNLLESQSERFAIERELNRTKNQAREFRHKLDTLEAKRRAFISERKSRIGQELVQIRRERDRIAEDLKKQERRSTLVQLTAPRDAVVLDIAERSVGSVVRVAEPFFTMVPIDVPLEIEVDVRPQDIAQLRVGDPARIKLEALPYQKHGTLDGELLIISEDTFQVRKAGGEKSIYRARLVITKDHLRNITDDFRLIPGMSVSAEIKVGKRRLISYFIYPVIRALDTSFREP